MAVCNVIIAGAGIAGIEGLLRMRRLLGDGVRVTLVSPSDEFVYRPAAVLEPFSRERLRRFPLERLIAGTGTRHVHDRLTRVDRVFRTVTTDSGSELRYDALLLALGAGHSNPHPHAALFTDRNGGEAFRAILDDVESGSVRSIAFVVPDGPVWSLPLYELALMTAHHARMSELDVALTIATAERGPLEELGSTAAKAIERRLDDSGIALHAHVVADVPGPGRLRIDARELSVDRIVTLPRMIARSVPGLPTGPGGFVPIDRYCRVPRTEGRVFAAGDATDSPFKHGGLGALQADTAAHGIAHLAGVGAPPEPLSPVIRATVLTGRAPLYVLANGSAAAGWRSEVRERPPWPPDHKVVAEELGPRLAALAAELVA
jgi:sulfide:quinone oxidoreductase